MVSSSILSVTPEENAVVASKHATTVYSIIGVGLALQLLFVTTRLYARYRLRGLFCIDDYFMGLASLAGVAVSIMGLISPQYGAGSYHEYLQPSWIPVLGRLTYAFNITFVTACTLPKIAICLTYLKLFPSTENQLFCKVFLGILVTWWSTVFLVLVFHCIPVNGLWELVPHGRKCLDLQATLVTIAVTNSISDLVVYLWPTRMLWNIQLPLQQRLGLIAVFCTGAIIVLAGAFRIKYLIRLYDSDDQLLLAGVTWAVSVTEVNVGVICGCLHGVRAVVNFLFPRLFSPSRSYPYASYPRTPPRSDPFPTSGARNKFGIKSGNRDWSNKLASLSQGDPVERGQSLPEDVELAEQYTGRPGDESTGVETWVTVGKSTPDVPDNAITFTIEVRTEISGGVEEDSVASSKGDVTLVRKPSESDSEELIFPVTHSYIR